MEGAPKTLWIRLLAIAVAFWGFFSLLDLNHRAWSGYRTDGHHGVIGVEAGSPAEAGGLRAGDVVTAVDGISSRDTAGLERLGRPAIGETRVLSVRRDAAELSIELRYGPLTPAGKRTALLKMLLGFGFLGTCVAAFTRRLCRATRVLAVMGIGIGLAFLPGPYIEAVVLRSVVHTARNALVLTGIAAMLHFLLVFPSPRPLVERPGGVRLLYAPAVIFWLLVAFRILFHPAAAGGLNTLTNLFAGAVVGGYFLFGIITLLRSYIRASGVERSSQGLNTMLLGTVLGLAPVTVASIIGGISPQAELPGSSDYFLALVLIPLSWSIAAGK